MRLIERTQRLKVRVSLLFLPSFSVYAHILPAVSARSIFMDYTLSSPLLYASASVKAALFVRQLKHLVSASEHPLPPSLASYPLVGNFFPLPLNKEYIAYMELSKQLQSEYLPINYVFATNNLGSIRRYNLVELPRNYYRYPSMYTSNDESVGEAICHILGSR